MAVRNVEIPRVSTQRNDVFVVIADWTSRFERADLRVVVSEDRLQFLGLLFLRLFRDEIDHPSRRRSSVNTCVRPFDDFDMIYIADAVSPKPKKTVAQLERGSEASKMEGSIDVQTGKATDLGDRIVELKNSEVFKKFSRQNIHREWQIADRCINAGTAHQLGSDVASMTSVVHVVSLEFDWVLSL